MIVFYDNWCKVCTAAAEHTKALDKKGKISFLSFRDPKVVEEYNLSEEKQQKMEQHLYIYKDGRSYEGINSVYVLAKAIPSYWIMVPFIKLSIVLRFGHKVYDYIAKNRKIVPTGHCKNGICRLPQKK